MAAKKVQRDGVNYQLRSANQAPLQWVPAAGRHTRAGQEGIGMHCGAGRASAPVRRAASTQPAGAHHVVAGGLVVLHVCAVAEREGFAAPAPAVHRLRPDGRRGRVGEGGGHQQAPAHPARAATLQSTPPAGAAVRNRCGSACG